MMMYLFFGILIVIAYLLGSIPTSVWVGRKYYGIDVREHGSKNAGATNTIRVLGSKAGIPVFIIDTVKGYAAVCLVYLTDIPIDTNGWVNFQLILGSFAVLGHIFPVFADFRGGKGVATLLGMMLALHPMATLSSFVVFALVVTFTRYISLGSISAAVCFPVFVILVYRSCLITLQIVSVVAAILLIINHVKNIKRLLKKEESKFYFIKRQQ